MLEALREGMGRQHRREFWEATIAVCALVAAPDGKVSFAARVRIDRILDSLPDLKVFDTSEFVELFDRLVGEFRANPRKARAHALAVARRGARDAEEAELLARVALAVVDSEGAGGGADVEPVEALCAALELDPQPILAPLTAKRKEARRAAPHLRSVEPAASAAAPSKDAEAARPRAPVAVFPTPVVDSGEAPPAARKPEQPASTRTAGPSRSDLGRQLMVEGCKAVIALCGRAKTGAEEALRIYENEQLAEADRSLAEQITGQKYRLSTVALFPAAGAAGEGGKSATMHVMCISRPDGTVEALRAFADAGQAETDLEFFRTITNEKMWVSAVQFKIVA